VKAKSNSDSLGETQRASEKFSKSLSKKIMTKSLNLKISIVVKRATQNVREIDNITEELKNLDQISQIENRIKVKSLRENSIGLQIKVSREIYFRD